MERLKKLGPSSGCKQTWSKWAGDSISGSDPDEMQGPREQDMAQGVAWREQREMVCFQGWM